MSATPSDKPQVLLGHHLKALKLPTFLREYDKVARDCAREAIDHPSYLLRLAELELIERERRMVERRIRQARFPAVKSLDTFDFAALPSLNKMLVLELARSEYILRRENIIALGNSGTGKSHVALALGLAACQRGFAVGFTTAASLVNQLLEARDERRLLRLQRELAAVKLLIVDELGYVPLSSTGAELLFEVFSQRYERGSTVVTSNLPFEDWTSVLGSERLTGALLDRLTHHVHILEMNGDSYRLKQSKGRKRRTTGEPAIKTVVDPKTGEISPHNCRRNDAEMHKGPLARGTSCINRHQRHWPDIAPPRWPKITPPLTLGRMNIGAESVPVGLSSPTRGVSSGSCRPSRRRRLFRPTSTPSARQPSYRRILVTEGVR